jgi:prepilin-type N-terminal cleavage/methylation domain-containing protein
MKKLNRKSSEGFTIIEVMIVLAIAGLIMLIVFMAVPALQRNSRNTQRKNDISSLLGAVNEYASNHNGAVPTAVTDVTNLANTGYYKYDSTNTKAGSITLVTAKQALLTADADHDKAVIDTGAQCATNGDGSTVAGSAHQVVIQYLIESSGGTWTSTCQSD